MVSDCAVSSYGQCWLHGPTPLDLYVNLTAEYELAPTHSGVVGRGWNPDTERFSYEIEYDLERTLYLGPPSRADDDDDESHLWLTCAAIATVAPQRVSEAILFGHRGATSSLPPIASLAVAPLLSYAGTGAGGAKSIAGAAALTAWRATRPGLVAYQSGMCTTERELMFDLLTLGARRANARGTPWDGGVDALGCCQGRGQRRPGCLPYGSEQPNAWLANRGDARRDGKFLEDALARFRAYRFCLVFESQGDRVDGYLSEKLLLAHFAGCVPIYLGHRRSAERIFDPRAGVWIDEPSAADAADPTARYRRAAARVEALASDDAALAQVLSVPPLRPGALERHFNWTRITARVARVLRAKQARLEGAEL